MNETTSFIYRTSAAECRFSAASDFWITHIDGAASLETEFDTMNTVGSHGANIAGRRIQPRSITIDGAVFGDVEANRQKVLDTILPNVPARFYKEHNGRVCHLDGFPLVTPDFADGNGVQEFQFQLFCAFPFWIEGEEKFNPFSQYTKFFKLPFNTGGTWQIASTEDTTALTVVNKGNAEQGFKARFLVLSTPLENSAKGNPQSEISLVNLTRGEELRFWVPGDLISRGDMLEFSTIDNEKGFWNKTRGIQIMPALQTVSAFNMKLSAKDNVFETEKTNIDAQCWIGAFEGVSAGE